MEKSLKLNGLKRYKKIAPFKQQKYWYVEDIYACVLCGKETRYRYRVSEKPENKINWKDDACPTHFL